MNDFTNGPTAAQPIDITKGKSTKPGARTYLEAAKEIGFPIHGAAWLVKIGIIPPTLDSNDFNVLNLINRVYKNPGFLKFGMRQLPIRERRRLVETADMARWESYVFSRYFNLKSNVRIRVKDVREEVKGYYRAKNEIEILSDEQIDARIREIRNQAHQVRFRMKSRDKKG